MSTVNLMDLSLPFDFMHSVNLCSFSHLFDSHSVLEGKRKEKQTDRTGCRGSQRQCQRCTEINTVQMKQTARKPDKPLTD